MATLKLKLSNRKEINLDLAGMKKKYWLHYLVSSVNYIATCIFVTLVFINTFKDDPSQIQMFKYTIVYLMVMLACVLIRVFIGGFKFWAESKFDIFALLSLIALISGLLVKQLFKLTEEGMLPVASMWQITIWGLLVLFLVHYLFDLLNRNAKWLRFLIIAIPLTFDVVVIGKFLTDWEINLEQALMIFGMLPFFFLQIGLVSKLRTKLFFVVNALALLVISLLNLDLDFTLLVLITLLFVTICTFVTGSFSMKRMKGVFSEIASFVRRKGAKARKSKKELITKGVLGLEKVQLSLFVLIFGIAIAIAVDLLSGGKFIFLKDSLQANLDAFKNFGKFHKILLGGDFEVFGWDSFVIVLRSYGILGIGLLVFTFGSILFTLIKSVRKYASQGRKNLMYANLAFEALIFQVCLLGFFIVIPAEMGIMLFVTLGIVAAKFGVSNNYLLPYSLIDFGKNKSAKLILAYRLIQVVGIVLSIAGAIYVSANISDIFLK